MTWKQTAESFIENKWKSKYKSETGNLCRRILWMFCCSFFLTTNWFSSFNFLYIFTISLTSKGRKQITSKKQCNCRWKYFYYEKTKSNKWKKNEDAFLLITAFSNARILLSEMNFFLVFFHSKDIELWIKLVEMINWIEYLMEIA